MNLNQIPDQGESIIGHLAQPAGWPSYRDYLKHFKPFGRDLATVERHLKRLAARKTIAERRAEPATQASWNGISRTDRSDIRLGRRLTPLAIKRIRHTLDVSQAVFADMLGVAVSAVQKWEIGNRNMPRMGRILLDRLLAERGIEHCGFFMDEEDSKEPEPVHRWRALKDAKSPPVAHIVLDGHASAMCGYTARAWDDPPEKIRRECTRCMKALDREKKGRPAWPRSER